MVDHTAVPVSGPLEASWPQTPCFFSPMQHLALPLNSLANSKPVSPQPLNTLWHQAKNNQPCKSKEFLWASELLLHGGPQIATWVIYLEAECIPAQNISHTNGNVKSRKGPSSFNTHFVSRPVSLLIFIHYFERNDWSCFVRRWWAAY